MLKSSVGICLTLAGITAITAAPVRAQSVSTPMGVAQIGLEGGATISNFIGDDANNAKNRTGGYGGLTFILHPDGSAIGFQTGVLYVMKGAKASFDNLSGVTGGVKLGYIEVPAMLRIGVPLKLAGIAPTVVAGGSFNWRISCKAVAESGSFSSSSDCDNALLNQDLDVKRFDGAATVGVELPIRFGTHYIAVPSVRYVQGLTNITDVGGNDVKNSAILIGVGLRFR